MVQGSEDSCPPTSRAYAESSLQYKYYKITFENEYLIQWIFIKTL